MKYLVLLLLLTACVEMPSGYIIDTYLVNEEKVVLVDFESRVFNYNSEGVITKVGRNLTLKDWNGKITKQYPYSIHHDAQFVDTNLLFLSYEIKPYKNTEAVFDIVYYISNEGVILQKWSSYDYIEELESLGFGAEITEHDVGECTASRKECLEFSHINSVDLMNNGDWLLSDRTTDTVFSVNPNNKEISWVLSKNFGTQKQHSVRELDNGNILMFDNGINASRAIEINLNQNEIVWQYPKELTSKYYSPMQGHVQRLKNGNTMVTNSFQSIIREVTPEGSIVWEYNDVDRTYKGIKVE